MQHGAANPTTSKVLGALGLQWALDEWRGFGDEISCWVLVVSALVVVGMSVATGLGEVIWGGSLV